VSLEVTCVSVCVSWLFWIIIHVKTCYEWCLSKIKFVVVVNCVLDEDNSVFGYASCPFNLEEMYSFC